MSDISKVVEFILQNHRDVMQRDRLPMWMIYDRPADYPDCYVARMFEVCGDSGAPQPSTVMLRAVGPQEGLNMLRDAFEAAGLRCIARSAGDQPQLVESWVQVASRRASLFGAANPAKGLQVRCAVCFVTR